MPISTWIRDIFGIRKDLIDTKKSKLEVKKLEEEDRARNLIAPATMDDIKEYDPRYKAIRNHLDDLEIRSSLRNDLSLLILIASLVLSVYLIYRLFRWLTGW